ncbi:MAG: hypothetical protein ACP5OG_04135 [Candidatus Nanoarchaeia archaeon]
MPEIDINKMLEGLDAILTGINAGEMDKLGFKDLLEFTATNAYAKGILDTKSEKDNKPDYNEAKIKLETVILRCYKEAEKRERGF